MPIIEPGDFRESGHERGLAAAEVRQRNRRKGRVGFGRFHRLKYGVSRSPM